MRFALVLSLFSLDAAAGPVSLILRVAGELLPVPRFVNSEGAAVSVLNMNFQGTAKEVATESVDSVPVVIRLIGALSYPAQVNFQRPQGCQIGPDSVNDGNVQFNANGVFFDSDGAFSIPSTSAVTVGLRFAEASALSGVVACKVDGGIVYSY